MQSEPLIFLEEAKRDLSLRDFGRWLHTEDGLRARCIEVGYAEADRIGLLKELHRVRNENQLRAWDECLETARRVVAVEGALWQEKIISFAEDAILNVGYAPPHWTLEQVENWLKEEEEKQRRAA